VTQRQDRQSAAKAAAAGHEAAVGQDPDKRNYVVSNEKLRKAGFEATMSLDEGIRGLLTLYRMLGRGEFANV